MGGVTSVENRRNARHPINDRLALEVVVRRHDDDAPLEAEATLIDVSRQGLKLSLSEPLAFDEVVHLEVHCREPDVDFAVTAEVKWLRRNDDAGAWIIGCSVSNRIPDEFFEEIASYGAYNRRAAPRHDMTKQAVVRWEACQKKIPVGIVNLSPGGFCISSPEYAQVGKGLLLELEGSDGKQIQVTAKSKWQLEFESGYLIGCESSVDLFREILNDLTGTTCCGSPIRSLTLPSLVGIVLIAAIFCAFAIFR